MLGRSTQIFTLPKDGTYSQNLATLRFLLAVYVFLFHLIPRYAFYAGHGSVLLDVQLLLIRIFQSANETNPAVIAFITLSGYCIHRNGFRQGEIRVREFLTKRLVRILPILIIGMAFGILTFACLKDVPRMATLLNTNRIEFSEVWCKLLGMFAFVPYHFEQLSHQGNGPLVTCGTELWLYGFYPIGYLLISRWGDRNFWLLLIFGTLNGTIACQIFPDLCSWWYNAAFLNFLPYWWIGVYALQPDNPVFRYRQLTFVGLLLLSAFLIIKPGNLLLVQFKSLLFSLCIANLLRTLDLMKSWPVPAFLTTGSFSLYALHVPLICWALFFGFNMFTAIIAAFIIAKLAYIYIEKPLLVVSHKTNKVPAEGGNVSVTSI